MLNAARQRAARAHVPFNLTADDIDIPKTCPILGLRLQQATGRPTAMSPSLDRIVPTLGYTRGNVRVISYRANTLKRDASLEELEALVRYMKETQ